MNTLKDKKTGVYDTQEVIAHDNEMLVVFVLFAKEYRRRSGISVIEIARSINMEPEALKSMESLSYFNINNIHQYLSGLNISMTHLLHFLEKNRLLIDHRSRNWKKFIQLVVQYPDILKLMVHAFKKSQKTP